MPGTRLSGHVVVRNPQPLSISELQITIYGISEVTLLRKISTIKNYFFGRGVLFQEITVLLRGPITLEPTQEGHRYPFSFVLPENTKRMAENDANFINKFKPRPPFAGAQEMHALPPSFRCHKKVHLGYHEISVLYRLNVTCTKGPGTDHFGCHRMHQSLNSRSYVGRRILIPSGYPQHVASGKAWPGTSISPSRYIPWCALEVHSPCV